MPPTACIVDAAVITARMMNIDVVGGSPGGRPKPKTRTARPTRPHSPRPMPPVRTPMRIATITTAPWSRIIVLSMGPPSVLGPSTHGSGGASSGPDELIIVAPDAAPGTAAT